VGVEAAQEQLAYLALLRGEVLEAHMAEEEAQEVFLAARK
jgi:hypothetical protein